MAGGDPRQMLRRVRELKAELWARPHCTVAALQRRNQEAAATAAATAAAAVAATAAATAAAAADAAQRHARVAAVHVPPLTAVQQYFGAWAAAADEQQARPRPDLREVIAEVQSANAQVFEAWRSCWMRRSCRTLRRRTSQCSTGLAACQRYGRRDVALRVHLQLERHSGTCIVSEYRTAAAAA